MKIENLISEEHISELQTFIANKVDFSKVKENSIFIVKTEKKLNVGDVLKIKGMLPKGVIIWLAKIGEKIDLESISESEMNRYGWYRKTENEQK
jgi:hypothetical protein